MDTDGLSGTVSLSISDYNPIKAVGHSAYMDAVAEELSLGKPPVDAIRLDYSGVQIVDYIDGAVANEIISTRRRQAGRSIFQCLRRLI